MLLRQNQELQLQASEAVRNEESHRQTAVFAQAQVNILQRKLDARKQKHHDALAEL